jgi:hypothetical protein
MRQMRSSVLAFAIAALLIAGAASPAVSQDIGSCVTPSSSVDHATGRLIQKFIDVFADPRPGSRPIYIKLAAPMPLRVVGRDGAFLQDVGGADTPFKRDQPIGWIRASDVEGQALRNCN